jgi:hypothetical protein
MTTESMLLEALDMLTEGADAPVVFGTQTLGSASRAAAPQRVLRPEALATHKENKSWAYGPDIQGLGIGEKVTDGELLKDVVLKIYVKEKKPESKLKGLVKIPKEVKIAGIDRKLPTDVEAIGKVAKEANTTRVRPAIPGFSLGHPAITAGTFGCLVRKKGDTKTLYILSNSHVLANEGLASVGDKIIQPGDYDGGAAPADVLATLAQFVPFTFSTTGYTNLVDAAIAKVKNPKQVTSAIRIIGVPAGTSTALARGMQVQKCGRTTDYTIGVVRDINYRTALQYKKPGGGTGRVGFTDQVLCSRYTAGGDSGSAVLNTKKQIVGLHFAGSDSSSIFNKIANVFAAFSVSPVVTLV